jgi:hypothetical protein
MLSAAQARVTDGCNSVSMTRLARACSVALMGVAANLMVACGPSAIATPIVKPTDASAATQTSAPTASDLQQFPDVIAVEVRADGERFDFDVTLSSPYDTPQRYADAFRVMDERGAVFGERVLLHDHQFEQPFTRDLYDVAIPAGVTRVIVQGRDQLSGYGGVTMTVVLPGRGS